MGLRRIYFGMLLVVMYTSITLYYFQNHMKDRKYPRLPPPIKLIVLVSQPRSGSSYLGNIISKSLQSIYFYEPLYRLDQILNIDKNFATSSAKQEQYDNFATQYLQNIFKCSFKQRQEWSQIFRSPFRDQSNLEGNECSEKQTLQKQKKSKKKKQGYMINRCMPYFDPHHLEEDCQRFSLMVKLLEMRLPQNNLLHLQHLIDDRTSYKIIYLMRDPRASFWSMLRLGWVEEQMTEKYKKYIQLRCDEMYDNIQRVLKTDNYVIVRYEDLMVKPKKTLSQLLQFVDDEVAQKILSQLNPNACYVPVFNNWYNTSIDTHEKRLSRLLLQKDQKKKHLNEKDDDEDDIDYKAIKEKQRNNYECFTINKWRYEVNKVFVDIVEQRCLKLMNFMGYKLLGKDSHLLKNIKYSLVSDYDKTDTE